MTVEQTVCIDCECKNRKGGEGDSARSVSENETDSERTARMNAEQL